jgi:hypothetical protein
MTGAPHCFFTWLTQEKNEQAQQVPPEAIEELAAHPERKALSIIDTISGFYAEHAPIQAGRWLPAAAFSLHVRLRLAARSLRSDRLGKMMK